MSSVANWSYKNIAVVHPFESFDEFTRVTTFGESYEIACTWTAGGGEPNTSRTDVEGREYVCKSKIWCEDPRPKYRDEIEMPGSYGRETIKNVIHYDMSALGEPLSPDFELSTG